MGHFNRYNNKEIKVIASYKWKTSKKEKYWKLLKENNWDKYHFAKDPKREDFVLSCIVAEDPDFSDLNELTAKIEKGTKTFVKDIEHFLAKHQKRFQNLQSGPKSRRAADLNPALAGN